jgi:septal ring factor EnvC (AmiA/AmiB activator)
MRVLLALSTILLAGVAVAQDRGVEAERARLVVARTAAEQARARAARLEREAARASDAAAEAQAKEAAVAARIQGFEAEIGAAEARVSILSTLQRRQARRLAEQQGPIVRLMAALQSLARRPAATALVQPGSISDLVHVRATLATVLPVVKTRTEAVRDDLERARRLRESADLAARALGQSRAKLAAERTALAGLEAQHRLRARDLNRGAMFEQDRAIALGEDARDIVDLMGTLDAQADIRARLAALPGPVMRPANPETAEVAAAESRAPDATPAYRLPLAGAVATGLGEVAATGVRSRGLTLAPRPQTLAVAPAGGKVAFAGPFRRYGSIVVIDHGDGWTSLITGLGPLSVRVGEQIVQGAPLGRAAGERPRVTVELRRRGRPVDITPLIG